MATATVEDRRRLVRGMKLRGWGKSRIAKTLQAPARTVERDLAVLEAADQARGRSLHHTALEDAQQVFRRVREKAWCAVEVAAEATRHAQVLAYLRIVSRATRAQLRVLKQAGRLRAPQGSVHESRIKLGDGYLDQLQ